MSNFAVCTPPETSRLFSRSSRRDSRSALAASASDAARVDATADAMRDRVSGLSLDARGVRTEE